jgi:hypothetical protein
VETFIVRVWTPSADLVGEAPRELQGSIEQVSSKQNDHFRTSEELLAILRTALEARKEPPDRA